AYMIELFKQEGMNVRVDEIGNVIARREGVNPSLPVVACGSHIDTVYNGGKYDGTVGVVAGLEVVRYLNDHNIKTEHPIEVIIFACEESARFGIATLGSKGMAGLLNKEVIADLQDKDVITLQEAMQSSGLNIDFIESAKRKKCEFKSFFELHIEQGPVLEEAAVPIGIVTGIAAPTRFHIIINGQAAHSGTTPMNYRRDAFSGATEISLALEQVVQQEMKFGTVATIGECIVTPGAMNVVPEKAEMKIDIRSISNLSKKKVKEELFHMINRVGEERKLEINVIELCDDVPIEMDQQMIQSLKSLCNEFNLSYVEMASGAGHDAMNMAKICPTGMVFVPSENGLSHNKNEFTPAEQIMEGVRLLTYVVLKESHAKHHSILGE